MKASFSNQQHTVEERLQEQIYPGHRGPKQMFQECINSKLLPQKAHVPFTPCSSDLLFQAALRVHILRVQSVSAHFKVANLEVVNFGREFWV